MGNHIFCIIFKVVKKVENAKFYSKFRTITSLTECKWAQPVLATYRSFQHFQFVFNLFQHSNSRLSLVDCFGGPEKGRLGCLEGKFQEERPLVASARLADKRSSMRNLQ